MTTAEELHRAEVPEDEPEDEHLDEDELEDDAEHGDTPEPEDVAPELPVFDPAKLEKEQRRHERGLAKVFGDSWDGMVVCEGCGSLGFVPQGLEPPPELVADPDVVVCRGCNGLGVRSTGSHAEGYQAIPCTVCTGRGYQERAQLEAAERAAQLTAQQQASAPPGQPVWDAQLQQWVTAGAPPPPPYAPPPASVYPTP